MTARKKPDLTPDTTQAPNDAPAPSTEPTGAFPVDGVVIIRPKIAPPRSDPPDEDVIYIEVYKREEPETRHREDGLDRTRYAMRAALDEDWKQAISTPKKHLEALRLAIAIRDTAKVLCREISNDKDPAATADALRVHLKALRKALEE